MEPDRVRTLERLMEILADGKEHEFWGLLMPGVHSRKTLKLCKNGKIRYVDHVCEPAARGSMAPEALMDSLTNIGMFMKSGNFVLMDGPAWPLKEPCDA